MSSYTTIAIVFFLALYFLTKWLLSLCQVGMVPKSFLCPYASFSFFFLLSCWRAFSLVMFAPVAPPWFTVDVSWTCWSLLMEMLQKSSESSTSWNLTSILRDSLGLKGVRKCLVWVWPSNKHRSETEITVSLVLYLYCPSHDRVRQLDPKKRFPSFSHPKMAEVTVTGRASATSARAPLCRPRHPSCRAPSRLGPWVRPGITAKKHTKKGWWKKRCKLTGCNPRWNMWNVSWLVTTKNVKGWWLRWIIVQLGLVVTNIALAGWNLRFTSLAAATIRCPTSSKVTRFLRSHVAMPFEYHRGFLSTWASSYVFLLVEYMSICLDCSQSKKFEHENWENREEHTEAILTSWHDIEMAHWAWKSLNCSFGFRCLHYERVQSWKACLQEGRKTLKMGRNRFSNSFSRNSADTFFWCWPFSREKL